MWTNLARKLIDPRYKRIHIAVIVGALFVHLSLHYATYVPALREPLRGLPYFRLHILHEAEFLLIVAYAGVVVGLRAGVIAIVTTGVTSIPFILTPFIFGRDPRPGEIRDLAIQVGFILAMGLLMILLYDRDQRRRLAESNSTTLREVDLLRNNFISMAAHELRNPMTSVIGFSELLMKPDVTADQRTTWAGTINNESQRLNSLIDELMSVSRAAAGTLTVKPERTPVVTVARNAKLSFGYQPKHPLVLDIPSDLPDVSVDSDKLIQVFVNLLSNAVKYSPDGGEIRFAARRTNDGLVRIDVTDQGLGISLENQERLFSTFYRVDSPEMQGIKGTCLGLSIVKALVEKMGGTVSVQSQVGLGSTFGLTVPVWTPEPAELSQASDAAQAA
ncbi:MAG: HAMP domain-containing sensor histidine kinase [Chloroflexi bacterium]|nr:HAMP domain-containing sensor histidine kinase [Chloroflexota bacterium]